MTAPDCLKPFFFISLHFESCNQPEMNKKCRKIWSASDILRRNVTNMQKNKKNKQKHTHTKTQVCV